MLPTEAERLQGLMAEMNDKLTFRYDKVGDILYVDTCLPYAAQESEEVGDEIIARLNPASGGGRKFGDFVFLEADE